MFGYLVRKGHLDDHVTVDIYAEAFSSHSMSSNAYIDLET